MNAQVAIRSARAYLRDLNGITWTDPILFAFLQEAHGELVQALELNSVGIIKKVSPVILIKAGNKVLSNQPTDIIDPLSVQERFPGGDLDSFIDMRRVTFIPADNPKEILLYWSWTGEMIQFVGSTNDREVLIHYQGMLTTPEKHTDPLGCIFAERYIGPRIAALAMDSIDRDSSKIQNRADQALWDLIRTNVVGNQRPVRRRAYRSPKISRGPIGTIVNVSGNGQIITPPIPEGDFEDVTFYPPANSPDGATTGFNFSKLPKFIVYNGLLLFDGIGYIVTLVTGTYTVTLKAQDGSTITPQVGDVIREAAV